MKLAIFLFVLATLPLMSFASELNESFQVGAHPKDPKEATATIACIDGVPTVYTDHLTTSELLIFEYQGHYPPAGHPYYTIQIEPGTCSNYPDGKTMTCTDYCYVKRSFSYSFTVYGCPGVGYGAITLGH